MATIGNIEMFDISGNLENYLERMDQFFLVNEVEATKKVPLFLTLIGADTYNVLKDLVLPASPATKTYDELKTTLKSHFCPSKNVIGERFLFHTAHQESEESIGNFIVRLRRLANTCEFGTFLDDALRDKLVCGIQKPIIQKKLLSENKMDFKTACSLALSLEAADEQTKLFQPASVNKVKFTSKSKSAKSNPVSQKTVSSHQSECFRCGRRHDPSTCPARNWSCFLCNKKGHTSKKCRSKRGKNKVLTVDHEYEEAENNSQEEESEEEVYRLEVEPVLKVNEALVTDVHVEDKVIKMEIDTGAGVSVISDKYFKSNFPNIKLVKSNVSLKAASGDNIEVVGQATVNVRGKNSSKPLVMYIIKNYCSHALLGRAWLDFLKPKWRENMLSNNVNNLSDGLKDNNSKTICSLKNHRSKIVSKLQAEYPKVFDGDKSQSIREVRVSVALKDSVIPVFHQSYPLPYALQSVVEEEINTMVKNGILVPVRHSEWASPIVVVPRKSTKSIRICCDFKVTLNPHLKTDHYPLPRVEEIFSKVADSEYFTVLDLSNAYLQVEVCPESQKLLTINTHVGLFQFTRLAFGLSCAPTQFQSVMDRILKNLRNVACYLDDVIIGGKTLLDAENTLKIVIQRLNHYNVRINTDKCKFLQTNIEFLGHELSSSGIKPLKLKTEAILKAPVPNDLTQLRSYLGLLNYYNKFLHMISSLLRPLYDLEKKNQEFTWSEECQSAFDESKKMIANSPLLIPYSTDKPIVIATDASPYGVGAVMSHIVNGEERPVMFISSTLTEAEKNYAQIQREALAIIFAVKKFHKYIYGRSFTLVTDHKPLETILGPQKNIPTLAASRLQRWAIILAAYKYNIVYKKGSDMANADCLSRLPMGSATEEPVFSFYETNDSPLTALDMIQNTKEDKTLCKVIEYARHGWPNRVTDPNIKPYYSRRNEISLEKGIVLWGNRIIIPYQLRDEVLEILHDQHIGIIRTKLLARSSVWWPGLEDAIESFIQKCESCQRFQPRNSTTRNIGWPKVGNCWQRLHVDFLYKFNTYFCIIVDCYSKWIDLHTMKSINAEETISKLRSTFTIFGLPQQIVSDNGPPFSGEIFKKFCASNGIRHTLTPPIHPKSNGTAEKYVDVVKRNLTKQIYDSEEKATKHSLQLLIDNFLLKHRTTPSTTTGRSPAEIMLKFIPKTKLHLLRPSYLCDIRNDIQTDGKRQKIKTYTEGEQVWFLNKRTLKPTWIPGKIAKQISQLTYLVNCSGEIRMAHVDDLKCNMKAPMLFDQTPALPEIKQDIQGHRHTVVEPPKSSLEPEAPTLNPVAPIPQPTPELRRSSRVRKIPDRLAYA